MKFINITLQNISISDVTYTHIRNEIISIFIPEIFKHINISILVKTIISK